MLCEKCHKHEATVHLSEIVKDVKSEIHLCEQCAREVGLNTKLSNFTISLPEMMTFLNADELADQNDGSMCPSCGCTFVQYKREGRLGCPDCYHYLSDLLEPVMISFHGEKNHSGKFPANYKDIEKNCPGAVYASPAVPQTGTDDLDSLRAELSAAVDEERYEEAAVIRDRINFLTGKSGKNKRGADE